jgi:large subunit ribosomal protein L33
MLEDATRNQFSREHTTNDSPLHSRQNPKPNVRTRTFKSCCLDASSRFPQHCPTSRTSTLPDWRTPSPPNFRRQILCTTIHLPRTHQPAVATPRRHGEKRSPPPLQNRRFLILTLRAAKSRTIMVRLISMAMTGYYRTMSRPRVHQPLSMLKYDPIGTFWVR